MLLFSVLLAEWIYNHKIVLPFSGWGIRLFVFTEFYLFTNSKCIFAK